MSDSLEQFIELPDFLGLAIGITESLERYYEDHHNIYGQLMGSTILITNRSPITVQLTMESKPNSIKSLLREPCSDDLDPNKDVRFDLYDLGCVLYEVATQKPYDPHSHVLLSNMGENNAIIPITIELILQKLLFKQPNDRYQTFQGLLFDLKKAKTQLEMENKIGFFMPGQRDKRNTLTFEFFLYGREDEKAKLQTMYRAVCEGQSKYVFVSGYAGVGKTALITQYLQLLAQKNGFFVSGKYDQYSTRPNQALIQAFTDLTHQIVADESNRDTWKSRILDTMGPNANVMVKLVPELVQVIGHQDDFQSSDSHSEANRISLSIKSFLQCFTRIGHPVVLFLDDLHRATQDETQFIESLIKEETGSLFFVGAYRSNEYDAKSPLATLIQSIHTYTQNESCAMHISDLSLTATQQTLTRLFHQQTEGDQILELEGLSEDHLKRQLKDVLQIDDPHRDLNPLTTLIFKKTHGNPLFVRQLLVYMQDKKHIWFDETTHQWLWDLEKINTLAISSNVLDLLTGTLSSLPQQTQDVIKVAACLGTEFELQDLAIVTELSASHLVLYLWHAEKQHLLVKVEDRPERLDDGYIQNQTFGFVHDRLQESAYALNEPSSLNERHWIMAKRLIAATKEDPKKRDQKLYWITNAINRGAEPNAHPSDHAWMIEWNLKSAEKSILNLAYSTAGHYLKIACQYLPDDHLNAPTGQTFECYKRLIEVEFLCGNSEEVDRLFKTLVYESQLSVVDKAEICSIYVVILSGLNRQEDAIRIGIEGLQTMGESATRSPNKWGLLINHYRYKWTYRKTQTRPLSEQKDRLMVIKIRMCMEMAVIAHTIDEPGLLMQMIFKVVKLSLICSCDYVVAQAIVSYGYILTTHFNDTKRGYFFGKMAFDMIPSIKYLNIIVKIKHIYASFILPWYMPYRSSCELLHDTSQLAKKSADYYFGSFADGNCLLLRFYLYPLCQSKDLEAQKAQVKIPVMEEFYDIRLFYFPLLTQSAPDTYADIHRQRQEEGYSTHAFYELFLKCTLCAIYGFNEEAYQDRLFEDPRLLGKVMTNILPMQISDLQFFGSLITFDVCRSGGILKKIKGLMYQWKAIKKMKYWSNNCKANFYHRYILMKAEWCQNMGLNRYARHYYEVALNELKTSEIMMDVGLFYERVAQFYLRNGDRQKGQGYRQQAIEGYRAWGANAKADQLIRKGAHQADEAR